MKQFFIFTALCTLIVISCSDKKNVNPLTENNAAPSLQIVGFEADTLVYVAGKVYAFEFKVTDESIQNLHVTAKVIGETGSVTIVGNTSAGLYQANFVPKKKGTHLIEISVSDGLETTTGTLSVFLGDNQNPVAVILAQEIERDVQNVRFTYEFDASQSSDRDSKIVKEVWNLDGTIVENPLANKFQHTFTYYANYQIELTVEDEFGGANSAKVTIDNSRPLASFLIRPGAEGKNGDQITLDATASTSTNGDINSYTWFRRNALQGLDIIAEVTANIFRFDVNMAVGANKIGLVVDDVEGNISDTTWVEFTVINQPPQASFTHDTELERIIITTNQTQDIDPGDTITFSWSINDSSVTDKENEKLPVFDVRGDVYQLTLTATDNHSDADSVTQTVSVPGVPEANFVFPDGVEDNFVTKNSQTVTIDGDRSIGGNESRGVDTYIWLLRPLNGATEQIATGRADFVILNVNHEIGDYEVGLKVTNLEGLESATTWRNLKIINSPPIAEFTCKFEAFVQAIVYTIISNDSSDPDPNDAITYHWFLDGVEQVNVDGPKPTFSRSHDAPVNTITLKVMDSHEGVGEKSLNGGCN